MPSKTHSRTRPTKLTKDNKTISFIVDLKQPIEDGIIDISDYENYIKTNLKVNGKKGTDNIEITHKDTRLTFATKVIFSKRYIKYLTKRYLKKQELRDFLRVVATDKNTYSIKFFNINEDAGQDDK